MAKNNLTPEQALITRRFYTEVACNEAYFPQDPVGQRNLKAICMRLLGYGNPATATYRFGQTPKNDISEEWSKDAARELAAVEGTNGADTDKSADKADNRESTESTEVREAVLREDV